MNIHTLVEEYNLEIDDIRWYLSKLLCEKFLAYKDQPEELTRYIWSGELMTALHDMEERFIEDLQDQINRGITDETMIREIMREIDTAKRKRRK